MTGGARPRRGGTALLLDLDLADDPDTELVDAGCGLMAQVPGPFLGGFYDTPYSSSLSDSKRFWGLI